MYVALLRAVNVAGNGQVSMARLREMAIGLGFERVQTLLNSGNLIFSDRRQAEELEALLEEQLEKQLQVATSFMVRGAADMAEVVEQNPFPAEAQADPSHLLAVFLKGSLTDESVQALREAIPGREVIGGRGRHLYAVYPDGIGRSKLTMPLIERKLGCLGTGRNWNTVLKLKDLVQG